MQETRIVGALVVSPFAFSSDWLESISGLRALFEDAPPLPDNLWSERLLFPPSSWKTRVMLHKDAYGRAACRVVYPVGAVPDLATSLGTPAIPRTM